MSFLDEMRALADEVRSIAGPTQLSGAEGMGVRTNEVRIVTRTWASGKKQVPLPATPGTDYIDDPSFVLTPRPKVERISSSLVASSGGRYEQTDLIVGPITPAYDGPPAGGYTPEQLDPAVAAGRKDVEKLWIITGPNEGTYRLIDLRRDRPFRYEAVIRRLN